MIHSSISKTLKQNFKDVTIYIEQAENISLPAFIIHEIESRITKSIGNYYRIKHFFQITYLPHKSLQTSYKTFNDIGTKLLFALEHIQFKNEHYRSLNMKYEIVENALHFFAEYVTHHHRAGDNNLMEKLETQGKVRR